MYVREAGTFQETQLTPTNVNVNANAFGKLFTLPVDGDVTAQVRFLLFMNS